MRPILIAGCERSGTTFLGGLLGANPHAVALPEGGLRHRVAVFMNARSQKDEPLNAAQAAKLVGKLARSHKFAHFQDDAAATTRALPGANTAGEVMERLINLYRQQRGLASEQAPGVWVEHSPDNLSYCKPLMKAYPDAKFVHIVRDGRAVYNSVRKVSWGPKSPIRAAQWWQHKLSLCFAGELLYPERVHRVKYEELILKPEESLRELCNFVGIPYDDRMSRGDDKFVADYTKSQHQHVGKGIVASRLDSYRRELPTREIRFFEKYGGKMLDMLDYEVDTRTKYPNVSPVDQFRYLSRETYHKFLYNPIQNYLRKRR